MKTKQLSLISLGVLSLIVTGCDKTYLRKVAASNAVLVESAPMSDNGVTLEDIKAELYPVPVFDTLYVRSKELVATDVVATDVVAQDSLSAERLTATKDIQMVEAAVAVEPAPTVQAVSLLNQRYYIISAKSINYHLQQHLGTSYDALLKQYKDAIAANKSLDQIPSLKVEYRFRAIVAEKFSEYIHFTLKDAFANFGLFIHLNEKSEIITYRGNPILMENLQAARLAAGTTPKVLADLFYPSVKTEIYKISNSLFAAFELVSGGKIWGFVPEVGTFKLLAFGTLPVVDGTARIAALRADSKMVSALGSAGYSFGLNHVLLFYVNSMGYVSKVFYANEYLVVKELVGSCAYFEKYGFLPLETKCQPVRVIEPIKVDSAVMEQQVLQLKR